MNTIFMYLWTIIEWYISYMDVFFWLFYALDFTLNILFTPWGVIPYVRIHGEVPYCPLRQHFLCWTSGWRSLSPLEAILYMLHFKTKILVAPRGNTLYVKLQNEDFFRPLRKYFILWTSWWRSLLPYRAIRIRYLTPRLRDLMSPWAGQDSRFTPKRHTIYLTWETWSHVFPGTWWKSHPCRLNSSPEGLIVSSTRLYTILLVGLRFSRLTKSLPEGLMVSSGKTWIKNQAWYVWKISNLRDLITCLI